MVICRLVRGRTLLPGTGRDVVGGNVLNRDLPGSITFLLLLRLSRVVVVHGPRVALLSSLLGQERFLLRVEMKRWCCVLWGGHWWVRHLLLLLLLRMLVAVLLLSA